MLLILTMLVLAMVLVEQLFGPVLILGVLREFRAFWLFYGIICADFIRGKKIIGANIYDFFHV